MDDPLTPGEAEPTPRGPDGPFQRLVVLGESTVEGGGWIQNDDERFADILARLLEYCQEAPLEYHNAGLGASVISPHTVAYGASRKPSALERLHKQVISRRPDLLVIAYGLNDMRGDVCPQDFRRELEALIAQVRQAINPCIVLVNVYHQTKLHRYPPFNQGTQEAIHAYNQMLREAARQWHCIHADAWAAEGGCDWVVHPDGVHANRIGNLLIAHRVLEAIVHACPGLATNVHRRDADTEWTRITEQIKDKMVEPVHRWEDA